MRSGRGSWRRGCGRGGWSSQSRLPGRRTWSGKQTSGISIPKRLSAISPVATGLFYCLLCLCWLSLGCKKVAEEHMPGLAMLSFQYPNLIFRGFDSYETGEHSRIYGCALGTGFCGVNKTCPALASLWSYISNIHKLPPLFGIQIPQTGINLVYIAVLYTSWPDVLYGVRSSTFPTVAMGRPAEVRI